MPYKIALKCGQSEKLDRKRVLENVRQLSLNLGSLCGIIARGSLSQPTTVEADTTTTSLVGKISRGISHLVIATIKEGRLGSPP